MSADVPLIIVNPRSGKGTTEQRWASMASVIRTRLGPFECEFTRAPGDATRLAKEAAENGRTLIVACGGDGTISEVANGILEANRPSVLGVLPGGTGGDFRRTLGIPAQLGAAARRLRDSEPRWMDAGKLHFLDHAGIESKRYFVNTASFGMSGAVAARANRSEKMLGGMLTYALATFRSMVSYEFPEILLQWDDQPARRFRIATVCVANGPSFGGG
ncbi:MAG TPA: diacylglycerol kinase family protein, partial [Acidobacteriota bacterium]